MNTAVPVYRDILTLIVRQVYQNDIVRVQIKSMPLLLYMDLMTFKLVIYNNDELDEAY